MRNRRLLGAPRIAACTPWPAAGGQPATTQELAQSLPPGAAASVLCAAAAAPAPAFCLPCVAASLLPLRLLAGRLLSPTDRKTCCGQVHDVHCETFAAHHASPLACHAGRLQLLSTCLDDCSVRHLCSISRSGTQVDHPHTCQASNVLELCSQFAGPWTCLLSQVCMTGLQTQVCQPRTRVLQNPDLGISVGQAVNGGLGCCCHIWGQGLEGFGALSWRERR